MCLMSNSFSKACWSREIVPLGSEIKYESEYGNCSCEMSLEIEKCPKDLLHRNVQIAY